MTEHESVVRGMITSVNELTIQRMLWMATFNGLLFATLGFAWDKPDCSVSFKCILNTRCINVIPKSYRRSSGHHMRNEDSCSAGTATSQTLTKVLA